MKLKDNYDQSLDFECIAQDMGRMPEGDGVLRDKPPELSEMYSFFTELINANDTGQLASYSTGFIMEQTKRLLESRELCQNVPLLVIDESILGNLGQLIHALKRRRLTALKRVL